MSLNLHFREIRWNLQMLASIIIDQTLAVNDKKLFIENRGMFAAFWRASDTRGMILEAIQFTFAQIDELLVSYQNCGLMRTSDHKETSQQDKKIVREICEHLQEICNFELKVTDGLSTLSTFKRYQTDSRFAVSTLALTLDFQKLCSRAKTMLNESAE